MKKNDLEQSLMFAEKRILDLGNRIAALEQENEALQKKNEELVESSDKLCEVITGKIQKLSDELYQHIAQQDTKIVDFVKDTETDLANRITTLSDGIYEYINRIDNEKGREYMQLFDKVDKNVENYIQLSNNVDKIVEQNNVSNKKFDEYKKRLNDELWMRTYGFDNMISELQLAIVEKEFPGNRAKLESLRDTHKGEKCFVIGNGPSLTAADLDKLKEKNIFCFASKGIYNIFDKTEWRPDVWAASDLGHIDANAEKINKLDDMIKLLCCQTVIKLGQKINNAIYFPFIQAERRPPFFNADIMRGVHFWGTVTCKLINFAVYMGFKEIYLLGTDNQYGMKKGKDGKYVYDINAKNHFSADYLAEKEKKECEETINDMVRSMEYVNLSFEAVKWHCDEMGIKIFNATRGGVLETFPRIDFDELVK